MWHAGREEPDVYAIADGSTSVEQSTASVTRNMLRKHTRSVSHEDECHVQTSVRWMPDDQKPLLTVDSSHSDLDSVVGKEDDGLVPEKTITFLAQFLFPFICGGLGQVAAGLALDNVQHWPQLERVSNFYILVPVLLGLKGNTEMCLSSRMSTLVNLHTYSEPGELWNMVKANLALVQVHAISIGFMAAVATSIFGWIPQGRFNYYESITLSAACLATASLASLLLGVAMAIVIILSKKCRINPDNIATPIASSLGDLTTFLIFSYITRNLSGRMYTDLWLAPVIVVLLLLSVPGWWLLSETHEFTKHALHNGWNPIINATVIGCIGGLILKYTVSKYVGIAVFQLIVNGVGGNLVSVQASRLSTALHGSSNLGNEPNMSIPRSFGQIFCGDDIHSHTSRILLAVVMPAHFIFISFVNLLNTEHHTSVTVNFLLVYSSAALIQVVLLLVICHKLTYFMWTRGVDPDNSAIPYLTAFGDLLGTVLLGVAFHILFIIGDRDSDLGD